MNRINKPVSVINTIFTNNPNIWYEDIQNNRLNRQNRIKK